MSTRPYLFLDVDGILHGTYMKYGFERNHTVVQKLPIDEVHPSMRPRRQDRGELPDWVARRRGIPTHVTFRTPVRTSPRLREDLAALDLDVLMLTSWLEFDSVDWFFSETGGTPFPYRKLTHPARDFDDPVGAIAARWKVDELIRTVDADPRPFIWADDDEVPLWRDELNVRYPDIPKLLIAPVYDVGLTRDHVARMREFVTAHGG